jgi:hypothetical protein
MSKLDLIREKIINTSKDEKLVRALVVGDEYEESTFRQSWSDHKGFDFNGIWITDPTRSECGRFKVNPKTYYGIDYEGEES